MDEKIKELLECIINEVKENDIGMAERTVDVLCSYEKDYPFVKEFLDSFSEEFDKAGD